MLNKVCLHISEAFWWEECHVLLRKAPLHLSTRGSRWRRGKVCVHCHLDPFLIDNLFIRLKFHLFFVRPVLLYVRKECDEVFDALMLHAPTLDSLMEAVSAMKAVARRRDSDFASPCCNVFLSLSARSQRSTGCPSTKPKFTRKAKKGEWDETRPRVLACKIPSERPRCVSLYFSSLPISFNALRTCILL